MITLFRQRRPTPLELAEQRAKVVVSLSTYNAISPTEAEAILDRALNTYPPRRPRRLPRLPLRRN
jgi:hypothetical protein